MKNLISTFLLLFVLNTGFGQNEEKIIGTWKYQSVTTTNPSCKGVDYFPITTFVFLKNGTAELNSDEGNAKANYKVNNSTIELFNLTENGVKQEGEAQFQIKSITSNTLTIMVEYECGSIDIVFKK
ncbi:MAG: hypothetical protein ACPGVC_08560 [Salibacteraceae bacterium]